MLDPNGLQLTEWRILATLAEVGPANATEIGRIMVLDVGRVSRVVRAMMNEQLVTRTYSATDKRVAYYELSHKGMAKFTQTWPEARKLWAELEQDFTEPELETFQRLLDKFISATSQKFENR